MKGIVLAGGLGTRLYPLTKITNKHLLPIYKKPMIFYPIEMLVEAGVREIMIVTGGRNAGDFLRLIGNGKDFGLSRIHYTYQEGEGGIAEALGLAEEFAEGQKVVVVLGDNILEKGISRGVANFKKQKKGARIFLKEVEHPWEYGIAEIRGRQDQADRREAEASAHEPRGHRRVHVSRRRVQNRQGPETLQTRRVGNY